MASPALPDHFPAPNAPGSRARRGIPAGDDAAGWPRPQPGTMNTRTHSSQEPLGDLQGIPLRVWGAGRLALGRARLHMRGMDGRIGIQVNGETRHVTAATITDLLREIGLAERKVAVERNLEIVPRSQYATTRLVDGDAIEIVHFIGGG